jgi:hypothetical protein
MFPLIIFPAGSQGCINKDPTVWLDRARPLQISIIKYQIIWARWTQKIDELGAYAYYDTPSFQVLKFPNRFELWGLCHKTFTAVINYVAE